MQTGITKGATKTGLDAEPQAAGGYGGLGAKPPYAHRFRNFLKQTAILTSF